MSEGLNERSQRILEAIIEDYIDSAEPVGSRTVTRRHHLSLSPASVRNVMADLEEMGYIVSPHTSAGRIPTEKGYRFYIDSLLRVRELTVSEQESIRQQYRLRGLNLEELLREAGKVLSSISHYTGIVTAPRLTATVFRHIEFIRLSEGRLLVVFVTQSGLVQNKLVFVVNRRATKGEISRALNELYGVEAENVNTLITNKGEKKAFIKLKEGYDASDLAIRLGIL